MSHFNNRSDPRDRSGVDDRGRVEFVDAVHEVLDGDAHIGGLVPAKHSCVHGHHAIG